MLTDASASTMPKRSHDEQLAAVVSLSGAWLADMLTELSRSPGMKKGGPDELHFTFRIAVIGAARSDPRNAEHDQRLSEYFHEGGGTWPALIEAVVKAYPSCIDDSRSG